jgi:hypothetical protein
MATSQRPANKRIIDPETGRLNLEWDAYFARLEQLLSTTLVGGVTSFEGRAGIVTSQSGDYAASEITNVPAGGISSATVQAALNELDTEKQPLDADLTAIAALTTAAAGRSLLTIVDPNADTIYFWDDSAGAFVALTLAGALEISGTTLRVRESFVIACSDETTNLSTGTAKVTFRMPYAFTLTGVRASVNTAPVGSTIIVDINEAGTTILSTKLTIDAGEETSTTAATPAVISDASLADDAEITIDIDQVGSTTPGRGLKVALIGFRP